MSNHKHAGNVQVFAKGRLPVTSKSSLDASAQERAARAAITGKLMPRTSYLRKTLETNVPVVASPPEPSESVVKTPAVAVTADMPQTTIDVVSDVQDQSVAILPAEMNASLEEADLNSSSETEEPEQQDEEVKTQTDEIPVEVTKPAEDEAEMSDEELEALTNPEV
jgi:hypothetical protein